MKNSLFNQYSELQKQIKVLEEKKQKIAQKCITEMNKNEVNSFDNDLGVFTLVKHNYYNYSNNVLALQSDIEIIKKVEQDEGIAKKITKEGLRFQSKRSVNNH